MKNIAAVFCLMSLSLSGLASPISFETIQLRSDKSQGVVTYTLTPKANGKLSLYIDPNHCGDTGLCTQIGGQLIEVDPTVISDLRDTDGTLLLQLTPDLKLEVGSGYNIDQHITITIIAKDASGNLVRRPMTPEVAVQVTK